MAERPTPGGYIKMIRTNVPILISRIQELAKAEIGPSLRRGRNGLLFAVIAAAIAFVMLLLLLLTGGFLFSMLYVELLGRNLATGFTLGFLTMTVLCLIIVAVLGIMTWNQVKHIKAPEATIAETKASISAVIDAVETGATDAAHSTSPVASRAAINDPNR